jgi:hypothetical protein
MGVATGASWLNLVERWFGLITAQTIRRGSFDSGARLEHAISRFLANWNENAKPFRWTKSVHQIKPSIPQGCTYLRDVTLANSLSRYLQGEGPSG